MTSARYGRFLLASLHICYFPMRVSLLAEASRSTGLARAGRIPVFRCDKTNVRCTWKAALCVVLGRSAATGRKPPKHVHSVSVRPQGTRGSHKPTNSAIYAALSATISCVTASELHRGRRPPIRDSPEGPMLTGAPSAQINSSLYANVCESPAKNLDGLLQQILTTACLPFWLNPLVISK